jgi:hypothetical protein
VDFAIIEEQPLIRATFRNFVDERVPSSTRTMLELWGDARHERVGVFGERVFPHFRQHGQRLGQHA